MKKMRRMMVYLSVASLCMVLLGCKKTVMPIDASLARNPNIPLLTQPQPDDYQYANQNRRQFRNLAVVGDKIVYLDWLKGAPTRNVYVYGQAAPLMHGTATGFQVDGLYLYYIDKNELTNGTVHIDMDRSASHPAVFWLMRLNLQTGERERLIDGCGTFQCHDGFIYYTPGYDFFGYKKNDETVPSSILQEQGNLYQINMDGSNRKLVYGDYSQNCDIEDYLFCDKGLLIRTQENEGGSPRYYYVFYTISEGRVEMLWKAACGENDRPIECGGQLYSLVEKTDSKGRIAIYPIDENGISNAQIGEYSSQLPSYYTLIFDSKTMNLIRPYVEDKILYEGEAFSLCEVDYFKCPILVFANEIVICRDDDIESGEKNLVIIPRT